MQGEIKVSKMKSIPKIKKNASVIMFGILRFVLIFGLGFIILKPLLGKVLMSFMSTQDLLDTTVQLFPRNPALFHWKEALARMSLPRSILNSTFLSLSIGLIQIVSCTLIGYGLSRFNFKGRGIAFAFVIAIMLVPYQVVSIAQYLGFVYFGIGPFVINLTDSFIPMYILAFTGLGVKEGLYIYLMKENFSALPKDLEDAAYIDGTGIFQTFIRIMVPNVKTMIITIFLFSICWQWTDTTYSSLYLIDNKVLANVMPDIVINYGGHTFTEGTLAARSAASIFIMLPLLGLFVLCQRFFVKSISQAGLSST